MVRSFVVFALVLLCGCTTTSTPRDAFEGSTLSIGLPSDIVGAPALLPTTAEPALAAYPVEHLPEPPPSWPVGVCAYVRPSEPRIVAKQSGHTAYVTPIDAALGREPFYVIYHFRLR
jgi:hypothetical protein